MAINLLPSIIFILNSKKIHKSYRMNLFKKLSLGFKMFLNNIRIETGSAYTVHLAMALKILETPPEILGDVVECGTWKGGSAANLSLVCKIVGRKLQIYDSFEGLPEAKPGDRHADTNIHTTYHAGKHLGTLDEVKQNIKKFGSIDSCEFIKGWFDETLPKINSPIYNLYLFVIP